MGHVIRLCRGKKGADPYHRVDKRKRKRICLLWIQSIIEASSFGFRDIDRISFDLPGFSNLLLHEYAGIDFTNNRLKTLNRRLLESMTRSNPDIKLLIENRLLYQDLPPKSPLDVLFS